MERLSPAVLEAFGLHSRGIKREKGHYLLNTAGGLVKLYISYDSLESVRLQHAIKEHLAEEGFPSTDRHLVTKSGQPYIIMGQDLYVAVYLPSRPVEADFENEQEVLRAFETLAHFHKAAARLPMQNIAVAPPLPEVFSRCLLDLAQAGKQVRRSSRMSDFDVFFIKNAPHMAELIEEALERLAATDYAARHVQAINKGSLCHNAMKEENFAAGATHLINFGQATLALQLTDLAALIRRYAQRSSRGIPADKLIDVYEKVLPLTSQAQEILRAQLIFPWAFLKLVGQYYNKKRNWTPIGLISRMEKVLAEAGEYDGYVRKI